MLVGTVVVAMFLLTGTVWGQVTASIVGTVKDSSGAVVPDTTVTIKNLESGLTRTAVTDANGNFSAPSLPIGGYAVGAEKPGFKRQERQGITLAVGQEAVVNLTLEVGSVDQQVTVVAEAPIVNTTLAPTSGLVGEKEVKDLPLNGRSFDQLLMLNVGTTNYTGAGNSRNSFSVAGRRPDENRFLVNGIDYIGGNASGISSTPQGSSGSLLGVDAVREFNAVSAPYGAEYGKRAGGQISIVTSSGTNQLHGSMFEYLRNSAVDARNFFNTTSSPPAFKRNQFGASLGGPIKRDKMFLFGNYEGFQQRLATAGVATVPDTQARLGQMPCNIITPAPVACPASGYAPVPNVKAGMLAYANAFWPAQNGPELLTTTGLPTGLAYNYNSPVQSLREDFGLTRFDYKSSTKDSFSANYLISDGFSNSPMVNPFFTTIVPQRSQVVSFEETHIFSPSVLNVATVGYSRLYNISASPPTVSLPANLTFVAGAVPGTIGIGSASAGVSGGGGAVSGAGGQIPSKNKKNTSPRRTISTSSGGNLL